MKAAHALIIGLLLIGAFAGCTQNAQPTQQPSSDFSPQEGSETLDSAGNSLVNDSSEVEIGQMV
ncbi:hypothetical protein HYY72_01430 [Candidatus Woesearchaeota archaeon]|nr:hypothetical protein [Candidatus Woesearchaeota archaeon]